MGKNNKKKDTKETLRNHQNTNHDRVADWKVRGETAEDVREDVKNPAVQYLWNVRNIFNTVQEKDSWIKKIWIGNKNHETKFHKEYRFLEIGMVKLTREVQRWYIFPIIFTFHYPKSSSNFHIFTYNSQMKLTDTDQAN